MKKEEVLKELEKKFKEMKEELSLKIELEELNRVFFIKDFILNEGFVSENLSRQICSRITHTYSLWVNYLNGILMPNQGYMPLQIESKLFSSKEERERIWELIRKAMEITSRNSLIGLIKDKKEEGKFIEDAFHTWNEMREELERMMEKVNKQWKEESEKEQ